MDGTAEPQKFELVEHLNWETDVDTLRDLFRVPHPGGKLVVTKPNYRSGWAGHRVSAPCDEAEKTFFFQKPKPRGSSIGLITRLERRYPAQKRLLRMLLSMPRTRHPASQKNARTSLPVRPLEPVTSSFLERISLSVRCCRRGEQFWKTIPPAARLLRAGLHFRSP